MDYHCSEKENVLFLFDTIFIKIQPSCVSIRTCLLSTSIDTGK